MKKHTVNALRGIPDFSYIPFDKAYRLAQNLVKLGGSATMPEFCELIGRKKTGWLGLEVKSMRVWGLVSGKGTMSITNKFSKISSSRDPNEKLAIKKGSFLNIPLFKKIFEKYSNVGLPKKPELSKFLESEYKINPIYSPSVAKTIIDSIQKYFKEYGKNYIKQNESTSLRKEVETSLDDFATKKSSINIKITSPIGNFNLEATNKEGFEKILKVINTLWDEEKDNADENTGLKISL